MIQFVPMQKRLLGVDEAAEVLSISARHLQFLTKKKVVPSIRLGERVLYSLADLDRWIADGQAARLALLVAPSALPEDPPAELTIAPETKPKRKRGVA